MIRAFARGVAALLLFAGAAIPGGRVDAADDPTLLFLQSYPLNRVRTDGAYVVWDELALDYAGKSDVHAADLSSGQRYLVAGGPAFQEKPVVDGGVVIWEERCPDCGSGPTDLRGKDLATGRMFDVATVEYGEPMPGVSGDWVVWQAGDSQGAAIKARNISTMGEPITLAHVASPLQSPIHIDGNRVLWEETYVGESGVRQARLVTMRIGESNPTVLTDGYSPGLGYDLGGDTVVYADYFAGYEVKSLNLASGRRETIASDAIYPSTDGQYVTWCSFSAGDNGGVVYAYALATGSRFPVAANLDCAQVTGPILDHGVTVWLNGSAPGTGPSEMHAARISDFLPSVRRPDPGSTGPGTYYFPETGHFLRSGFQSFWDGSGGLPVFGFPITEEFQERNPDIGSSYTVQYFERQRFEYHIENAGTPYEVLLGRLGAADAEARGLLETVPFQPLASSSNPSSSIFFPETGHTLSGYFLSYWQEHGLEFGHPGTSFQESVALLGYPISEEFVDPETGLVTQYFERAVLEYHAENPDPYKVLLRRLGAGLLSKRGW